MGYSNKRKRSKRRKTKTLTAIQNNVYSHDHNRNSSDDSSSDNFEHCSNHTRFFSSHSHFTTRHGEYQTVPSTIFLDDVTLMNPQDTPNDPNRDILQDHGEMHVFSVIDSDNIDDSLNHSGRSLGDVSLQDNGGDGRSDQSSCSSSEDSFMRVHVSDNFEQNQHHSFDQLTQDEVASFKIMSLLDSAGAPRICYDRLVGLLKKLSMKDGFDVKKALNRDTLMKRIGRKYKSQPRIQSSVINKQEVFRFIFQDMLQDLLHSCHQHLHFIVPDGPQVNTDDEGWQQELWNTPWMRNTFAMEEYKDFDAKKDIMLPIMLYMDKTGTDVNQRYSLEPVLFSIAAIPREHRESRHSWRHLGFIPQKQNNSEEDSSHSLQSYHDSLYYILDGLREAQRKPPAITVRLKCGKILQRVAMLPVVVVMGDQLSQDTLCGRLKSNSGGAGRVHRSCMCSYLNIDDPYHACKPLNIVTLTFLLNQSMVSDDDIDSRVVAHFAQNSKEARTTKTFLQKQRAMYRSILRHPFTTHPIHNAFTGIHFGSWSAGIHEATFDDFMHSVEAGMISYTVESVYDGLTKKEKETVEEKTRPLLDEYRCSVTSNYPRWRLQPGFTRQTLMTSGERVGSILALSLSLQDRSIRETIRSAHHRQTQKYLDLSVVPPAGKTSEKPTKPEPPPPPPAFYLDQYMRIMDDASMEHTLEQMIRHGFNITLIDELDPFQINQLITHCSDVFKSTRYPDSYPVKVIDGIYSNLGQTLEIPKVQLKTLKYAVHTKPSRLMDKRRLRKVEGTVEKHHKKKASKKGEGSSAAVLTSNMGTLVIFLEYLLCYHAFCKYSWSLPVYIQRNLENIKAGNRFLVEYFQKLIYRGNHSVDSRFPKIHAQRRMGENMEQLNTVMNFCCETGERLLKTEAKGISRTAQQRGNNTFLTQTMARVQERSVLDSFAMYLEERDKPRVAPEPLTGDRFGRTYPHFLYVTDSNQIYAVSRKNESQELDTSTGFLSSEVIAALKTHEPNMKLFRVYNEVVLRDNSRLRASPNYHKTGPWYDYVNVSWERLCNGTMETYLLPAKCLCFYPRESQGLDLPEIMALIHTVDQHSVGKVAGCNDTLLTRNYKMQFDNKGTPVTHVIPVASIDSAVRCFPHVRSTGLFNFNSPGITYLLPRNHWAYMWVAMNDAMNESNSAGRGKLNSLCNTHWLDSVRERYQKYINESGPDSIPYIS